MEGLIFKKKDVLAALTAQLATHKTIVVEAWEGYKVEAEKQLRRALDAVEAGERAIVQVLVTAPEDHTDEIERAIQMLEMTTNDHVELGEHEFTCYVQGRWGWAERFLLSNSRYSQTAMSNL